MTERTIALRWRGIPVEQLTRDQLLEAIYDAAEQYAEQLRCAQQVHQFYAPAPPLGSAAGRWRG